MQILPRTALLHVVPHFLQRDAKATTEQGTTVPPQNPGIIARRLQKIFSGGQGRPQGTTMSYLLDIPLDRVIKHTHIPSIVAHEMHSRLVLPAYMSLGIYDRLWELLE